MKKYINVGFMAILTMVTFVLSFSSCSSEDDDIMGEYPPAEKPEVPQFDNLAYIPGANVQLINKAEYCKSIIADGKELITGEEYGAIRVLELKDEKVYITFKEDLTSLANAFSGCSALKSIPENLFANCPKATDFSFTFFGCKALTAIPEGLFANNPKVISLYRTFEGCKSLKSIPEQLFANNTEVTNFSGTFAEGTALISIPAGLFDNNRKVSDFSYTFYGCSALTGESPYTMIGDQKVHIYERNNYLYIFSKIENRTGTFSGCNGLTDLQSNSI